MSVDTRSILGKVGVALVLSSLYAFPACAQTNYSKTVELPALRISLTQLQDVLNKAFSLMSTATGSARLWREEMDLRRGGLRVKIAGHKLDAVGIKIPDIIDAFEYTALTKDPSAISSLKLDFSDFRRQLSIEGQAPEQVDAVFSVLRDELSTLSSAIGGSTVRLFFGFPAIWLLLSILSLFVVSWYEKRTQILLIPISLICLLIVSLLFLPTDELFAGFIAFNGDSSFIVRYGPQISFFGLVIGVVAIPLSLLPLMLNGRQKRRGNRKG